MKTFNMQEIMNRTKFVKSHNKLLMTLDMSYIEREEHLSLVADYFKVIVSKTPIKSISGIIDFSWSIDVNASDNWLYDLMDTIERHFHECALVVTENHKNLSFFVKVRMNGYDYRFCKDFDDAEDWLCSKEMLHR